MSETKQKQNPWLEGYKKGKEEGRSEAEIANYHTKIRRAFVELIADYRAYITTLNNKHYHVDTNDLIAFGKLAEAEKLFFELRFKEQERKKTQLNELQDKNKQQTNGGIVRAVKPSYKAEETVIEEG